MYDTKFMPISPDSLTGEGSGGGEKVGREGEIEEYFKNSVNCAKIIENR